MKYNNLFQHNQHYQPESQQQQHVQHQQQHSQHELLYHHPKQKKIITSRISDVYGYKYYHNNNNNNNYYENNKQTTTATPTVPQLTTATKSKTKLITVSPKTSSTTKSSILHTGVLFSKSTITPTIKTSSTKQILPSTISINNIVTQKPTIHSFILPKSTRITSIIPLEYKKQSGVITTKNPINIIPYITTDKQQHKIRNYTPRLNILRNKIPIQSYYQHNVQNYDEESLNSMRPPPLLLNQQILRKTEKVMGLNPPPLLIPTKQKYSLFNISLINNIKNNGFMLPQQKFLSSTINLPSIILTTTKKPNFIPTTTTTKTYLVTSHTTTNDNSNDNIFSTRLYIPETDYYDITDTKETINNGDINNINDDNINNKNSDNSNNYDMIPTESLKNYDKTNS
ncbi:putative uncharacterized protein DDB_G0282499 [Condylostylus longicornis]|uniref:putative uncharacterized protein DDB_G0282499 n=1 Tax=Condylostylus longicornis TaxID=2530218 RepID=UPI00244DB8EE|nr:putative uncharacterized protein DDB_G0282499 [Condylostylus longicornis]